MVEHSDEELKLQNLQRITQISNKEATTSVDGQQTATKTDENLLNS